jgi:hypothetical protein
MFLKAKFFDFLRNIKKFFLRKLLKALNFTKNLPAVQHTFTHQRSAAYKQD